MLAGSFLPYVSAVNMDIGWLAAIVIIAYVIVVIGLWKMFDKAGEAGWKALIPIYNTYILFKISWQTKMFWIELAIMIAAQLLYMYGDANLNQMMLIFAYGLSLLSAIIQAVLCYNISLAYGHGIGYFLGIYLLSVVFFPIIGYGPSRYAGNRYAYTR